ncbi:MAG: sigma 54-interacting transcriptional regulator [Candidatus Eisenbacteria bacterium]|uniref:Sigma 54-interacting transcriptional regulator n=1 Tax=Eiseniibacteriota bacterium TaxID=2212470 RepID=A0A956LY90_UNCEI|nr:sigma 54-interacting transcriptional regulator [Candidatus Eisenbacteria bacterium]
MISAQWLDAIDEPMLAIDADGRIAASNEAAATLSGRGRLDLVGQPCSILFPKSLCSRTDLDPGPISRWETTLLRRDGVEISVRVSRAHLEIAEQTVWTLFTIRASDERPESEAPLARLDRSLLDTLEEGVVTIDDGWRVTALNHAAQRILGTPEHTAIGSLCSHVLRSEACQDGCPLARALEQRSSVRNERVHLTRHDGGPVSVSMNCAILRDPCGEARGGVLSFRELTEPREVRSSFVGDGFHGMIARSAPMRHVFRLIEDVADSPSTVLITGESGVGKELVAEAIQQESTRRHGPFVKVNCAVFSEGVLESELFGHVKGSFTGAGRDHRGRFELAHGGTLFLDEISEISPRLQVKLLRVLQDRRFERVGDEATLEVDLRLIAATNRDLEALVREGKFREDLYYRLNVIPIRVPPLRDRRDDVRLLVDHFVHKLAHLTRKPVRFVDEEALAHLVSYRWPGNVRQLENAIEYAFARAHGEVLTLDLFPPDILRGGSEQGSPIPSESVEAARIRAVLDRHHWHHAKAAAELGISRTTLWRRMRRLGLDTET